MKMIDLQCPHCSAELQVNSDRTACYCEYCGSKILLHDDSKKVYNEYNVSHINNIEQNRTGFSAFWDFMDHAAERKEERRRINEAKARRKKELMLWALGWIFCWPIPLTILIVRELKKQKQQRYNDPYDQNYNEYMASQYRSPERYSEEQIQFDRNNYRRSGYYNVHTNTPSNYDSRYDDITVYKDQDDDSNYDTNYNNSNMYEHYDPNRYDNYNKKYQRSSDFSHYSPHKEKSSGLKTAIIIISVLLVLAMISSMANSSYAVVQGAAFYTSISTE